MIGTYAVGDGAGIAMVSQMKGERKRHKAAGNRYGGLLLGAILVLQLLYALIYLLHRDPSGYVTETAGIELAGRSLIVDEYIGYLYPLMVRLAVSFQNRLGIPYYIFVYCMQGGVFLGAAFYLVNSFAGKRVNVLRLLAICTLPGVLQCMLQISPYLMRSALALFLVGSMMRLKEGIGRRSQVLGVMLGAYFLAGMNFPEDAYLWGILLLVFIALTRRESGGRRAVGAILLLCLVMGLAITVQMRTEISGGHGRMQRTMASMAFRNGLWEDSEEKLACLEECFPDEWGMAMWPRWQGAEEIQHSYGAQIDYVLGADGANRFYRSAAALLWQRYGGSILMGHIRWGVLRVGLALLGSPTLLLFAGLLLLPGRNTGRRRLWARFAVGAVAEVLFVSFAAGPVWDQRACVTEMVLLALFCLDRDWSPEEKELEGMAVRLGQTFTSKRKKQLWAVIACAGVILLTIGVTQKYLNIVDRKSLTGRVVCLGDSIWGLEKGADGIAAYVEEDTGLLVENYAVPGSSVGRRPGNETDAQSLESILDALERGEGSREGHDPAGEIAAGIQPGTADWVLLAYGLNDYYSGVSVENYRAGLERAIRVLRTGNPEASICIIGPTECLFYQNGVVVEGGSDRDFGEGTLVQYRQAACRAALENGVGYIDMGEELPISRYNDARYLKDGTHLTEFGRKKYARALVGYLLEAGRK